MSIKNFIIFRDITYKMFRLSLEKSLNLVKDSLKQYKSIIKETLDNLNSQPKKRKNVHIDDVKMQKNVLFIFILSY